MKKITSLLMLFLLFVGIGNAQQVTIAGQPSDPKTMKSGYYVIKNVNAVRHSGRYVKVDQDKPKAYNKFANEQSALTGGYIWYLEISDQGVLISTKDKTKYWRLPKNDGGNVGPMEAKNGQYLALVAPTGTYKSNKDVKTKFPKAVQIQNKTAYDASVGFAFSTYRANGSDGANTAEGGIVSGWQDTGDDQLFAEFYAVTLSETMPFKFSTLTSDNQFGPDMHWYRLQIQRNPVKYSAYNYLDNTNENSTNKDIITEGSLYAFVGDALGFKIYNKAAGPNKILWSQEVNNNAILSMSDVAQANDGNDWILNKNGETGYVFQKIGKSNGYINDVSDHLGYWTSGASDPGSTFKFIEITPSAITHYNVGAIHKYNNQVVQQDLYQIEKNNATITDEFYNGKKLDYTGVKFSQEGSSHPATATERAEMTYNYTADFSALPFEVTTDESHPIWYMITIDPTAKLFWYKMNTNQGNFEVKLKNKDNDHTDELKNAQYQWCFKGDPVNGFKIYNKVTMFTKSLSAHDPAWLSPSDRNETRLWRIKANGNLGYGFQAKGASNFLNKQENDLKYWSLDPGCSCRFLKSSDRMDLVNFAAYAIYTTEQVPAGVVGYYPYFEVSGNKEKVTTAYNAFKTDMTGSNYNNLKAMFDEAEQTRIQIDPAQYYRLKNVMRKGYIAANTDGKKGGDNPANRVVQLGENKYEEVNSLWQFVADNQAYNLRHANSGKCFVDYSNVGDGTAQKFALTDWGKAQWGITNNTSENMGGATGQTYMVQFGDGGIGRWNAGAVDGDHAWYIEPVNDININITAAKWATICLPMAVTVPTGVEAYYASSVTKNGATGVIYLKQINGIIPAQTPVLLFSETAKNYQFPIASEAGSVVNGNLLYGKTVKTTLPTDKKYYGLGLKDGKAVFGSYTSAAIPANKVLLQQDKATQQVQEFRLEFGEPTGVENVELNNEKSNIYYDLNGRRVLYPVRGIYVNGNGQKVFVK